MKPEMNVVRIKTQAHLLIVSNTSTNGLGSDNLGYDKNGGNQGSAWSRGNDDWDDEDE
jgi:hypothetical protein